MKETDSLIKKALKYKESGLTDYEIAEELNVSKETAAWLLNKGKDKKPESKYFKEPFRKAILDELELDRYCCRRHMLGHVDIIDYL